MNWGSSKSDNFVQNKYKPFFIFLKIRWDGWFFVSIMKLYSSTLGRLFKQLSNFHAIYFISFFAKRWVMFVWNLRCCAPFGVSAQTSPHCPGNPSLYVKILHFRSGRMVGKSYSFHYQNLRFPVETVSADAHQMLSLRPCWDVAAWVSPEAVEPTTPRGSEPPIFWKWREWVWGLFCTEDSTPLRNGTQMATCHF